MTDELDEKTITEVLLSRRKAMQKLKNKTTSSAYGRGRAYSADVEQIIATGKKICTECRVEKDLSEFSNRVNHPTGKKSSCKKCDVVRMTVYRHSDLVGVRLRDRINHYKRKYGMSEEEATALVNNREGLCEICRNLKPLVVDHSHTTNKVRGKICSSCNTVLGYAKDDVDILLSAIEYLDRNKD